jgi:hypothetical protein
LLGCSRTYLELYFCFFLLSHSYIPYLGLLAHKPTVVINDERLPEEQGKADHLFHSFACVSCSFAIQFDRRTTRWTGDYRLHYHPLLRTPRDLVRSSVSPPSHLTSPYPCLDLANPNDRLVDIACTSTSCQSVSHPHYTHRSGYANAGLSVLDRVEGGAPWGAATIAGGDGSRQPSETELSICTYQVSLVGISLWSLPLPVLSLGGKGRMKADYHGCECRTLDRS